MYFIVFAKWICFIMEVEICYGIYWEYQTEIRYKEKVNDNKEKEITSDKSLEHTLSINSSIYFVASLVTGSHV